jgi:phage terminase large subunit
MIEYEISRNKFNKSYLPFIENETPTQIFFGGSASGKSYFLAQRTIIDVVSSQRNYLICRKTARTIKRSVMNELLKAIDNLKMNNLFELNKTDNSLTCVNGSQILTAGLDDTEKIKSITPSKGIITDIWIEEATEVEYEDVQQLRKRLRGESKLTKRLIMSFNPIYQTHWIYKEYFGMFQGTYYNNDDIMILKTTYKDNAFLTEQDVANMENEKDDYYYNVYTLGNWGVLGKTIFKNYVIESFDSSTFDNYYNGLDFGFASDPAAFIRLHYDKRNKIIYIIDEFEELELTNDVLANKIKTIIGNEYITCDSAEPKSIRELQLLGVKAKAAKKGKDSINFGIDWLKRHKIVIHPSCINVKREIETYQYQSDKNGIYINKPLDKDNHLIDALRYALEECFVDEQAIFF